MREGLTVVRRLLGLPAVHHDAYIMRKWSACHAMSLSVMYYDYNCDSHVLQ